MEVDEKEKELGSTVAESLKELVKFPAYIKPGVLGDRRAKILIDLYISKRPTITLDSDTITFENFTIRKSWAFWWYNADKKYISNVLRVINVFAKTKDNSELSKQKRGEVLLKFIKSLPYWRLFVLRKNFDFFKKYVPESYFK